jgi:hypothetical protein
MTNDTAGEAPTVVTTWGNPSNGDVNGSADGGFTYTPGGGFSGTDTFSYTITDANGDSASATVSVTVGDSAATRTVGLTTSKSKGNNVVTLTWAGFTGTVSIHRNGAQLADNQPSEGSWQDNLGKGISGTFEYRVCDTECATASVSF